LHSLQSTELLYLVQDRNAFTLLALTGIGVSPYSARSGTKIAFSTAPSLMPFSGRLDRAIERFRAVAARRAASH
jgi:hypothetical protein